MTHPPVHSPVHLVVHDRGRELAGVVRPGESWWAAARRTCASLHAAPVPLDLSGEVKEFAIDHDTRLALRAMGHGDLEAAVRWRSSEAVRRWWSPGGLSDPASIHESYGRCIDGLTPTRMWVVEVNGRPVGFLQDYLIGDYPEYAERGPDPAAIGVDYAIGEPDWLGRGLGVRMLWAWMLRARTRFPDATAYFAAPDHRNTASLRILAKAGFVPGERFEEPQDDGTVTIVVGCRLDVPTVVG